MDRRGLERRLAGQKVETRVLSARGANDGRAATMNAIAVIRHADSGKSFAAWALGVHSPEGAVQLLQKTGAMQEHAEDTLDLLWGALSDPELNPNFAPRASDMLAAAEAARQAQEGAQSVQGA